MTLTSTIDFSRSRWLVAFGAPMIPLLTALIIAGLIIGMGFVGRLPVVGSAWMMGVVPFIGLCGIAMAFLLVATVLTWPLMVAAVAIDDSDSFGGLSRAYSGLTGRPWRLGCYYLVSLLVGKIFVVVMVQVLGFAMNCVMASLEIGYGENLGPSLVAMILGGTLSLFGKGLGVSFFWSASAVIYLLIRQEIDGAPVDQIAPDDAHRPVHDPLPVVGIPATDAPTGPTEGGPRPESAPDVS